MTTLALRGLRTASRSQRSRFEHLCLFNPQFIPSQASLLGLRHASTISNLPAREPRVSLVNGPASTRPAPLEEPVRAKDQSLFSFLLRRGKAYLTFYKTGIWNIYANMKLARDVQKAIDARASHNSAVAAYANTRSDLQLLVRNHHDLKRVPIFALVLFVCGEFTPLVVLSISSIVPWTCRIPKQVDSDRRRLEQRRSVSFRALTTSPPTESGVQKLGRIQLLHINSSLGLSSRIWDWVGGSPSVLLKRRVRERVDYLELDDALIRKAGGIKDMDIEEVKMALVERGVDVLGKGPAQLKGDLNAWLLSREKAPAERLLLTRPAVWPVRMKSPEKAII